VIVVVPADIPVTTPDAGSTVAIETLELVHAFDVAGVLFPSRSVVEPTHTSSVPVITNAGRTVTTTSSVAIHPFASVPVTVYVCVVVGTNAVLFTTLLSQL
jgi:hypothetical protein